MYGYIIGKITEVESNHIILDNNNIGYQIYVANPFQFELDKEYKVYLYSHIKEDEHNLFGFKSKEEKELFLKLISVKGLGPRMTLPILAAGSISGLSDAIERENILYLKKFPKVGDKLARQMILDLKGKLVSTSGIYTKTVNDELIEVLVGLGYKQADIKRITPQIDNSIPLEEQVKQALKLFLNKGDFR